MTCYLILIEEIVNKNAAAKKMTGIDSGGKSKSGRNTLLCILFRFVVYSSSSTWKNYCTNITFGSNDSQVRLSLRTHWHFSHTYHIHCVLGTVVLGFLAWGKKWLEEDADHSSPTSGQTNMHTSLLPNIQ
jgi:hypothetical protein